MWLCRRGGHAIARDVWHSALSGVCGKVIPSDVTGCRCCFHLVSRLKGRAFVLSARGNSKLGHSRS